MKKALTLLICWLGVISLHATVCPSISFSSQAEIDAFPLNYPGCTTVTGDVLINGPNIINLNGLAQINTIEGNLDILFNPALTSLIGLDAVTFIGGSLSLDYDPVLTSLIGLSMVTFIGGDISIQGNDALTGLAGLGSLTYIGGNLNISYNSVLTSLTGLDALNSIIGNLSINNNPHLVSLTGLGANTSIGGGLYIQNNEELISCEIQSICDYLAIPGNTAEIFGNAFGCSSLGQIQNACGILVTCLDSIFFNSQAEIDAYPIDYPGCNTVIGNVIISGSDIINLNGLNQINTIEGNLTIAENDALTSLMGLNMVSFIGGNLWISGNNVLTDLTGLGSVASIGGTPYC